MRAKLQKKSDFKHWGFIHNIQKGAALMKTKEQGWGLQRQSHRAPPGRALYQFKQVLVCPRLVHWDWLVVEEFEAAG